jgi:hypothetical protein
MSIFWLFFLANSNLGQKEEARSGAGGQTASAVGRASGRSTPDTLRTGARPREPRERSQLRARARRVSGGRRLGQRDFFFSTSDRDQLVCRRWTPSDPICRRWTPSDGRPRSFFFVVLRSDQNEFFHEQASEPGKKVMINETSNESQTQN